MVAVVAVGVGVLLVTAGGDDDGGDGNNADDPTIVQPGAPGEDSRELTEEELAEIGTPEPTETDIAFMQDMLVHHRQALTMAGLVAERTERADLPLLAERIVVSQEAEIDLLEAWLEGSGAEVPDAAHDAEHAGMPGMASADQLTALEAASGPAFDRQFLELMIAHHQGAVLMVTNLYGSGGGLEPSADRIARDIEADQNIEIQRMQDLLLTLPA